MEKISLGVKVLEIPKVYFDTNILINYFWAITRKIKSKNNGNQTNLAGRLQEDYALMKRAETNAYALYWSIWGFWELKEKIYQQLYQNKCISYGYQMPKEHEQANKYVPILTKKELGIFSKILNELLEAIPASRRKKQELDESVIEYMVQKGCGFIDSILFYHAYKNNCDFFVTRDDKFKDCIGEDYKILLKTDINIIKSKDLMERLQPNICWKCKGKMESNNETHDIGISSDGSPITQEMIYASKSNTCGRKEIHHIETINL